MALLQLRVNLTDNGQGSSQRYQLDGEFFEFIFRYNGVSDSWFFDINDDEGNPLIIGIGITISSGLEGDEVIDLLAIVRYRNIPKGRLFAFDTSRQDKESGLEDIDSRVVFLYEEVG